MEDMIDYMTQDKIRKRVAPVVRETRGKSKRNSPVSSSCSHASSRREASPLTTYGPSVHSGSGGLFDDVLWLIEFDSECEKVFRVPGYDPVAFI